MPFLYQAQKFAIARRRLMLPHPNGEAASIVSAFHECSQGLHGLDARKLDDKSRTLLAQLTMLMDTSDVADPHERGPWTMKASAFTAEQKFELSRVIDDLAGWFEGQATKGDALATSHSSHSPSASRTEGA